MRICSRNPRRIKKMKKTILKSLVVLGFIVTVGFAFTLTTVSADAVYDVASDGYGSVEALESEEALTLEAMLTYALQDEYMAQAEYQAIITTYGEIKPFTNILLAEGTHIGLLLPLFEAYGIAVPANDAAANVIIPESITSALATGVQAEEMNIAMYEKFLAQTDLPDDVRNVFTYLMNASIQHQNAFAKDRYSGLGSDVMNQLQKKFQFKGSKGNQNKAGNQYNYQTNEQAIETCPNL